GPDDQSAGPVPVTPGASSTKLCKAGILSTRLGAASGRCPASSPATAPAVPQVTIRGRSGVTPAGPGPLWGLLAAPMGRPPWERIGGSEGKGGNLSDLKPARACRRPRCMGSREFPHHIPNPSAPTGLEGLFCCLARVPTVTSAAPVVPYLSSGRAFCALFRPTGLRDFSHGACPPRDLARRV